MSSTADPARPAPADVERLVRSFVDRYVEENRSVLITSAFDVAYGGCGPFAECLAEEVRQTFADVRVQDRDTGDMLADDPCLPRPEGYDYDFHVYVEVETSIGPLFYDAVTPQGMPYPSMLSFNAEQVRFARAFGDRETED